MDLIEDLSARVLLKNILSTEPPRTPIAGSASTEQRTSETRRSPRLSKRDAGAQTPKDILRRSLKHKIRDSITRKSLPATKRRTASVVVRKTNTPASASMLLDNGDTPRHILRNILLTEPVKSPVVHDKAASEEPQLPLDDSSSTTKRHSVELSGLDLPDLTIGNIASTAKGLSRKRPRRSLNVTAFEKRLREGNDVEEENEESIGNHPSLSLSSCTSLSLKTPFVEVHTEKRGLQRKVSNRRKITEEEFGAAVNKRHGEGGISSFAKVEKDPNETTYSEGFNLGLTQLSEPDITTDIVNSDTALYTQSDAMTSNFSSVAMQDRPTVMTSQLQREIRDLKQIEEKQSQLGKEKSLSVFPAEGGVVTEPQNEECISESQSKRDVDAAECQKEEGNRIANSQLEDAAVTSKSKEDDTEDDTAESEEKERLLEAQIEDEGGADPQPERDFARKSQSGEEEVVPDSETEEEQGGVDSQPEEDGSARSESEEEMVAPDSQTEEKQEGAAESQTEDEDEDEEEGAVDSHSEGNVESLTEDKHDRKQGEEKGEQASEKLEHDLEHISRRAHGSEVGFIMPIADATEAEAEPDADKEDSFHLLEVTSNNEESGHLHDASPEEAAAQDPAEQEEELEDEEDSEEIEEFPCKTPAFVREKRDFFHRDPLASPVLKNIQTSSTSEALPAAKPKKVQQRKRGPAKKEAGLPKNYLMGVFRHFAKTKVSADVYPALKEIMDKFFDRLADDLVTFAGHAKRKTIEVEDAELLLKRQGYVNDKVPVEVLIEKYLRMEQRKLLIPIATSGNVVFPKKRR